MHQKHFILFLFFQLTLSKLVYVNSSVRGKGHALSMIEPEAKTSRGAIARLWEKTSIDSVKSQQDPRNYPGK